MFACMLKLFDIDFAVSPRAFSVEEYFLKIYLIVVIHMYSIVCSFLQF
jgi:hypothetical protein